MTTGDPRMRIADRDREQAMADLATHYADGRLEHEEYDERLDAVWTARTRADLAVLFTDLPRLRPPQQQPVQPPAPSYRRAHGGRSGHHGRFPLLPVLAVLILLSVRLHAPLWLLVFPAMFVARRRRQGPPRSSPPPPGFADYRRSRDSW